MMAKKLKKVFAILLCISMLMSMLSISAFAASDKETQADKQIVIDGGTNYYKADGSTGSKDDHAVALSKNVLATGEENVFDIELKVETSLDRSKLTRDVPDAAVSLVIDASATMAFRDLDDTSNRNEQIDNSRLNLAKAAMRDFLTDYAKTGQDANGNPVAHRWVSLVGFGGQAWNYLYSYDNWLDVAVPDHSGQRQYWYSASLAAHYYSGK